MKRFFFVMLAAITVTAARGQQLTMAAPAPLPHGSYGDIHASPGILGDNYYIVYKEMARKLKGDKDPGDAYLKIYSLTTGTLRHTVCLDSALGSQPEKNIFFSHVFLWHEKLIGVYASWKPGGTWADVYAAAYSPEGCALTSPVLLGTLRPGTAATESPDKVLSLDAKNVVGLARALDYRFNRDSSRVAVYYAGDAWSGLSPVLMTADLAIAGKWKRPLPAGGRLIACSPGDSGQLVGLVRKDATPGTPTPSFKLLSWTPAGGTEAPAEITLSGKTIQDAGFRFLKSGDILVTGTYTLPGKAGAGATYGVFALKMDRRGKSLHADTQAFGDAMISDLESYKAAAKNRGVQGVIRVKRLIPVGDAGMVSVGTSTYQGTEVSAYPIILAPHYDAGGKVVLTKVDDSGNITWTSYLKRYYENYPSTEAPAPFFATLYGNNRLMVVYDENGEQRTHQQIFIDRYGDKGIVDRDWMTLPRSFNTRSTWILWNTAARAGAHAVMVAYYDTWKKELGTIRIGLSGGGRLTANR